MFRSIIEKMVLICFICLFVLSSVSFAQCPGGRCNVPPKKFKTPVRSYFSNVKPVRHALGLSR